MSKPDYEPFFHFVNERHAIYLRKTLLEGGKPKAGYDPLKATVDYRKWSLKCLTDDPILHRFRFCNVFRELDRVTLWIDENIRKPFADHEHLWFMLAIARTINWPSTLQFLLDAGDLQGWPSYKTFSPEKLGKALDHYKACGYKVYTGAYMIRAESNPKANWYHWTKQRYVAEIVLGRLWEDRITWMQFLEPNGAGLSGPPLEGAWEHLQRYLGWGPFMAFQVVLEWRHTRYLANAPDRSTWAAIGPGSMRGLNRLYGRPVDERVPQLQALFEMRQLLDYSKVYGKKHVPPLEMEDVQNSLCETDKYLRVKLGEGRPRAQYIPGRGY